MFLCSTKTIFVHLNRKRSLVFNQSDRTNLELTLTNEDDKVFNQENESISHFAFMTFSILLMAFDTLVDHKRPKYF